MLSRTLTIHHDIERVSKAIVVSKCPKDLCEFLVRALEYRPRWNRWKKLDKDVDFTKRMKVVICMYVCVMVEIRMLFKKLTIEFNLLNACLFGKRS